MANDGEDTAIEEDATRLSRRRLLGSLSRALGSGAFARVFYEYTGFGHLTGTNLREQSLEPLLRANLEPTAVAIPESEVRVRVEAGNVLVEREAGNVVRIGIDDPTPGAEADLPRSVLAAATDLSDLDAGAFSVEFHSLARFFDRLSEVTPRPLAVASLRGSGYRRPTRDAIRTFAGVDPSEIEVLISALATGFRDHSHFDWARYLGEVMRPLRVVKPPGTVNRTPESTRFKALSTGQTGLYCYEYALRTVEAVHALPPARQTLPVFGALVIDERHNHAYAGLGSVFRDQEGLHVAMTFVDYFYATVLERYRLRWVLGEGIDAYDRFHRATALYFDNIY